MRKSDGSLHDYFADQIGSANIVTNATASRTVQDIEFHPYGEEKVYTDTLGQEYRFTGKEHDPEAGNDYFGARYYSSTLGRFLTPDWAAAPAPIPYANPANPQTLNLYAYVENNPITGIDPDGHWDWTDVGNFIAGFGNALGSDNLGGAGRVEQTTTAGRVGAAFGDAVATIQGTGEALSGLTTTGVGVATAATGVGVAVAVVGVAEISHGATTAGTGFTNTFW